MFGKKMTNAQADAALKAALKVEAAKAEAEAERRATYLTCGAGHFIYAGESGCRERGRGC